MMGLYLSVRVYRCGGWVERVYGRRKRYIKIHFTVDINTKEVISMDVTTDDVHDSEVLPRLLKDASMNRDVAEAFMDGAYDTRGSYIILRRMGIRPIIKPRANARTDRGPPERRISAAILKMFGERGWSMFMGYGRRWAVETAFSTYKRLYVKKHRKRAKSKSIHIQHTNKHTNRYDKRQTKEETREVELGHKALKYVAYSVDAGILYESLRNIRSRLRS
jgi:hypothetical protein